MQLLGTTGNVPGPTAARAQMAYEALLAAQAMNPKRKKRAAERASFQKYVGLPQIWPWHLIMVWE